MHFPLPLAREIALDPHAHPAFREDAWCALKAARGQEVRLDNLTACHGVAAHAPPPDPGFNPGPAPEVAPFDPAHRPPRVARDDTAGKSRVVNLFRRLCAAPGFDAGPYGGDAA